MFITASIVSLCLSFNQDLPGLINNLDSEYWTVRDSAHSVLLESENCSQVWLEKTLKDQNISLEARGRLLQILVDRIVMRPAGGLGIRMELIPIVRRGGLTYQVKVVELIKGMPAEKYLKIGDIIERLDGLTLTSRTALQEIVQSKNPQEVVAVEFRRKLVDKNGAPKLIGGVPSYEKKEILIPLGKVDLLGSETLRPMKIRKIEEAKAVVKRFLLRDPELEYIFVRIDKNTTRVEKFRKIIRKRSYIEDLIKKRISSLNDLYVELGVILTELNSLLDAHDPKWPVGFLKAVKDEIFKIKQIQKEVEEKL